MENLQKKSEENIEKKLNSLINRKATELKTFILDFYKYLDSKGKTCNLDDLMIDFSFCKKNVAFECPMCKNESEGVRYISSHDGIMLCQKCFNVNIFMKKHPFTFYADTGFEDMDIIRKDLEKKHGNRLPSNNPSHQMSKREVHPPHPHPNASNYHMLEENGLERKDSSEQINEMIATLDKNFQVSKKYKKEDIINAIKFAEFDETKAMEKLITNDYAHL